ncbi:hypothetical protein [Lichenicola sp.]|uniref:hypothetical protein n=1 Tax=Lichenicola sp. TaxID=2804529 RepID=UPI003AFFAF09
MIMHDHWQTLEIADRIMPMQRGTIPREQDPASTSVVALMAIARRDYRSARAG